MHTLLTLFSRKNISLELLVAVFDTLQKEAAGEGLVGEAESKDRLAVGPGPSWAGWSCEPRHFFQLKPV